MNVTEVIQPISCWANGTFLQHVAVQSWVTPIVHGHNGNTELTWTHCSHEAGMQNWIFIHRRNWRMEGREGRFEGRAVVFYQVFNCPNIHSPLENLNNVFVLETQVSESRVTSLPPRSFDTRILLSTDPELTESLSLTLPCCFWLTFSLHSYPLISLIPRVSTLKWMFHTIHNPEPNEGKPS